MQPVTPPRARARSSRHTQSKGLQTPTKTPFGKKLDINSIHKPLIVTNSPPSQLTFNQLTPPSTTPRHSSRKKRDQILDDAFFPTSTNQRSIFPPTPSTIGSGRSKNFLSVNNVSAQLVSPLRKSSNASIDEQLSPVIAPTKRKLIFASDSEDELTIPTDDSVLGTPRSKLINDDLINEWNREKFESDDEDGEIYIRREKLKNPFVTSSPSLSPIINRNAPKQTEITLINKKGERIIRKLTQEEQAYKPRNLFDSLTKSKGKIDVYNDNE